MRIAIHAFSALSLTAFTIAQQPAPEPATNSKDVLALVSRAETLLKGKETEDAILVLWQALAQLALLPDSPVHEAARLSARHLLATNDAREERRRAVFASVGKQQVELAALYRGKKWLDTAATRLAVADAFDREVSAKEHALLDAAKPKPKPTDKPAVAEPPKSRLSPLLQRANTDHISGEWREVDDCLECQAPDGDHVMWVTKATHADHEVVVEFRPAEPLKAHNAILSVGLDNAGTEGHGGYRLSCTFDAKAKEYGLYFFAVRGMQVTEVGSTWVPVPATADGFHRLSIQVHGTRLRGQLDGGKPVEVDVGAMVRGSVALLQGVTGSPTCAVRFRNFRIDPLPADMPTDDELRAKAASDTQNEITKAVDAAKDLITKKQPEPASLRLREALGRVQAMEAGVLRDNLAKTIEQLLQQTDPFAAKRKKTAQTIAGELATLADEYGKSGMVRAAEILVTRAASFDPDGQQARLAAARDAVQQWNLAQATARASELQPPADDGAVLREWFGKGRKLATKGLGFTVEGAVARALVYTGTFAAWLPPPLAKPLTKASVFVRLTRSETEAGLCFDVVDETDFGIVFLQRLPNGMRLYAMRWLGTKWVPLLHRDVPMDAWRRDAWHQVTVESTEQGLVARCAGVELKVERKMLGKPTGVFGLHAASDAPEPLPIELRAFQPGQ